MGKRVQRWEKRDQCLKGGEGIEEERVDRSVRLPFPSLGFAGLISGSPERRSHTQTRTQTDRRGERERVQNRPEYSFSA